MKKEKYIITLANDVKINVFAFNHNEAIKEALFKIKNSEESYTVGYIIGCLKDGEHEDEEMLYSIPYLKDNGFLKGLDFKYLN